MKRLLAFLLAAAAPTADAGRFRAPVLRPGAVRAPLAAAAASLAPVPSLLPGFNGADAPAAAPSALAASELTPVQVDAIERYSARGVERAEEFLRTEPLARGGYLLGIAGEGRHEAFAEATGLTPFTETYVELFGRAHPVRTPEFLDYVTRSGEETVFLVPPKALTHEKAGVTKEELEWLFDHPERMKSVRFVFGAYDLPEVKRTFPVSADAHRLSQRRRHAAERGGAAAAEIVEADPRALLSEFEREIARAPMVRERASRGMLYFQTPAGTYLVRRILRGYFLEVFPEGGGGRKEAFVSKRSAPLLFDRVAALW